MYKKTNSTRSRDRHAPQRQTYGRRHQKIRDIPGEPGEGAIAEPDQILRRRRSGNIYAKWPCIDEARRHAESRPLRHRRCARLDAQDHRDRQSRVFEYGYANISDRSGKRGVGLAGSRARAISELRVKEGRS